LVETLTLRILELEERVKALESKKISSNIEERVIAENLLFESEERVKHLQSLLQIEQSAEEEIDTSAEISDHSQDFSVKPLDSENEFNDSSSEINDYPDDNEMPLSA